MAPPVSGPTQSPNPANQTTQEKHSSSIIKRAEDILNPKTWQGCKSNYDSSSVPGSYFTLVTLPFLFEKQSRLFKESNNIPQETELTPKQYTAIGKTITELELYKAYEAGRDQYCAIKLFNSNPLVQALGPSIATYVDAFPLRELPFFGDMISGMVHTTAGNLGKTILDLYDPNFHQKEEIKAQPEGIPYSEIDRKPGDDGPIIIPPPPPPPDDPGKRNPVDEYDYSPRKCGERFMAALRNQLKDQGYDGFYVKATFRLTKDSVDVEWYVQPSAKPTPTQLEFIGTRLNYVAELFDHPVARREFGEKPPCRATIKWSP